MFYVTRDMSRYIVRDFRVRAIQREREHDACHVRNFLTWRERDATHVDKIERERNVTSKTYRSRCDGIKGYATWLEV